MQSFYQPEVPAFICTNISVYGKLLYPKEGQIYSTLIYFLSIPLADHDKQVRSIYIYTYFLAH